MIAALMATTSSWSRRLSVVTGIRLPRTRIIGKVPTFRCRSDAPLSTATFSRSLTCMDYALLAYRIGRRLPLLLGIDETQPAVAVRHLAVDDVEERALQPLGHRTPPSAADGDLVDGPDRRHLRGRSAEERLVREIQRLARQHRFLDRDPELAGERDDRIAGNAAEDRRRDGRRVQDAVADDEDVLAAAFADVAVHVERNRFRAAGGNRD